MTQAIIFDMDGTLFQTNLILEPALEATFNKLRSKNLWKGATPIEQYREIMGVPLPTVWETLCPMHSSEIRNQSNKWFQQELIVQIKSGNGALYHEVEETLKLLAMKYPLYIASNGEMAYLQAIIEQYQLNRFIQKVYSIECISSNNKSDLVQWIIKENHITRGYVIGDRSSDLQAAKDNQLTSIGVRFDFAQESELELANYVVTSFKEILTIV
ncbi:HAD hydrolase-like protein [Lysinibacillus sp. BW-2-10]|uniref:HAD hydrolase-like protein n=1 Tax=Lysinibacillus sp. BW-2-10 TaxID=2590030 RepID=UPI00117CCCCC|nr:HAD hydrolase-like protein [Lysinibacillus sp. BW-2-10]TSI06226.1 HAD family hydrolase [Lysinibacillus sp. BW-2-10]